MMPLGPEWLGKQVFVLGLGRSGQANVLAFQQAGAHVIAWDDRAQARESMTKACKITDKLCWDHIDALVPSPGIAVLGPHAHYLALAARKAQRPLISDVSLMARLRGPAQLISISGTNGKSTTTALLGHILAQSDRAYALGGNFGCPVLDLDPLPAGGVYVLELSSFQLDLLEGAQADGAILLNIAPDHLDRHGTMENYVHAKQQLFANVRCGGFAVIGSNDPWSLAIAERLHLEKRLKLVSIMTGEIPKEGVGIIDGRLFDALKGSPCEVFDFRSAPHLPGSHSHHNAASAYVAAILLGLKRSHITTAFLSFPGLPHRFELVAHYGNIKFINDSKATNAASAMHSLALGKDIFWIAGGQLKKEDWSGLIPFFGRVVCAFLIGDAAPILKERLNPYLACQCSGTLDRAIKDAFQAAQIDQAQRGSHPMILLAPGCASFDQFANFEERGESFRRIATQLAAL